MRPTALLAHVLSVFSASVPHTGRGCVLYIDPCGSDYHDERLRITTEACESEGIPLVGLWSAGYATMQCARTDTTPEEADEIMAALAPPPGEEQAWASQNLEGMLPVIDVVGGSDAGLECSERLLDALVPSRSNGLLDARRDKYNMHEQLRAAGLSAAKQVVASEWCEAATFLEQLPKPLAVVLKPRRGQASLRVGLARSVEEAAAQFERVLEMPSTLDVTGDTSSVLLQVCAISAICAISMRSV